MIKELYNDYMEWNSEFEKEFEERTDSEIAYDIVILEELDKGSSIEQAL